MRPIFADVSDEDVAQSEQPRRSVEFREADDDSNDPNDSNDPKTAGQDKDDTYMDVETRKHHFREQRKMKKKIAE